MKNLYKKICFILSAILVIEIFPLSVESSQVFASQTEMVTYDLSAYCNQVEKSQEFAEFLNSLDEAAEKTLIIPDGQVLILDRYFTLPSNTTLQGGAIEFVADSQYANVYNEAYIINRHSETYWDGKQDENITIKDTTIYYDCSINGRSLIRFRNVTNFAITGCKIEIINEQKTNVSHNGAIDLFKGCTNGTIENNDITLDNPNGFAGGAIWIRSASISGNDPEYLMTKDIQVLNNTIRSNSCDELLAVGSSGYHTSDILILGNTFIRENGSKKNLMLGVCPSTFGNISNVTIKKNTFYMYNESPIMNKEILRVGGVLDTTNYPYILSNIILEENEIIGNLANSKGIVVKKEETNGASVKISKNSIKNMGESNENSYGIIASGPNIVTYNQVEGMETSYVLDEETKLQDDTVDGDYAVSDNTTSSTPSQDKNETESPETGNPEKGNPEAETPETGNPEKGNPEAETPEIGNPETGNPETGNQETENQETETPGTQNQSTGSSETEQSSTEDVSLNGGEKTKSTDKLKLKLKRKKSAITLKWKRVSSAKGYVIYGARKGKKLKKIKTIKKGTTTSWTHKKLKSKKTYKYVVKAYTIKNGKKKWLATSKTCFAKTK